MMLTECCIKTQTKGHKSVNCQYSIITVCRNSYRANADEIAELLTKMCLDSKVTEDGKSVQVEIPPTRADSLKITLSAV